MWPVLIPITMVNLIISQSSWYETLVAESEDFNAMFCWLCSCSCSHVFSVSAVERPAGYLRSGEDFSSSQERHWKVSKFSASLELEKVFCAWSNRF